VADKSASNSKKSYVASTSRNPKTDGRRWASYRQTALYLGVTDRTVREMVADGRLTQYSLGPRIVRFDLNEVDAAMTPQATA